MFSLVTLRFLTVIWFITELWLSHTPGNRNSRESRFLSSILHIDESLLRKMAHVFCFAVLSLLSVLSFGSTGLILMIVWCVVDELTKKKVPGRHCSIEDILLNILGTLIGVDLWSLFGLQIIK